MTNDFFTTLLTIVVPIVALIWKVSDFFITKQKIKSSEQMKILESDAAAKLKKIEKDAEIEIKKAEITASLRTQEEVMGSVRESTQKITALNNKFNSLIDFLVTEPALREKLRRGDD